MLPIYPLHYGVLDPSQPQTVRCQVCYHSAFGMNYGVPSCNACKMFFRRVVLNNVTYQCRDLRRCYWRVESSRERPKCRACRFQRCLDVGMKYTPGECSEDASKLPIAKFTDQSPIPPVVLSPVDVLTNMIQGLLYLDSHRLRSFTLMRSDQDPTIDELINRTCRGFSALRISDGPSSPPPCNGLILSQWSFFGVWTSVEFLNCIDFMHLLTSEDKEIMIKSFAMNSYLLSSAFFSASYNSDLLLNPDGTELYSCGIKNMPELSEDMVERVQKLLVAKLKNVRITQEEYILMTMILFCTPKLPGISRSGLEIVSEQQRKYSKALMDYCRFTRHDMGPLRFQELISVGTVLAKCFDDVLGLVEILQVFHAEAHNYKQLFKESLHK
ncbi:hypothetical protein L5515_006811 [Caenorhabditis briggsae]|uniref:Uncharacterized protein n=1 Tax=Caenorhabditis briggsae TaxID=6238 RepID=A0AAE9JLC2_CAEBR|nr:hypothetical protein L5515_006811 [Caenorhabditis briggsae]